MNLAIRETPDILVNTLTGPEHSPNPSNLKCGTTQVRTPIGTSIIAYAALLANPPFHLIRAECRRNPEYKSCAMRAPVPLYAPRPVRLVCSQLGPSDSLMDRLNGRNAEYSGRLASTLVDLSPEPDREEKGLSMTIGI